MMTAMMNVHLHGRLGKKFGKLWTLAVRSPAEAFRAIESRTHKLFEYLYNGDKRGITYRVVIGREDITDVHDLLHDFDANVDEIHVYPIAQGSGSRGVWQTILGIIIIIVAVVVTIYAPGASGGFWSTAGTLLSGGGAAAGAGWAGFFAMMGAAIAIGGITQMIMGSPSFSATNSAQDDAPSYYFSGARNNMRQGGPIPIGYGRMIVGSQVISMAIRTERIDATSGGTAGDAPWQGGDPTDTTPGGGGGFQDGGPADYYDWDRQIPKLPY